MGSARITTQAVSSPIPKRPPPCTSAFRPTRVSVVERAVQPLVLQRRHRRAGRAGGDGERALLVGGLGAAEDRDEQHAGEEPARDRQADPDPAEPAVAHAGAAWASNLRSSGAPRSGNGTSTTSKSRGTSVRSNTARASSRISPPAVAAGQVRQREHPHVGLGRDLGRLLRGAVAGLQRPRALGLHERRLVHEHVGAAGGVAEHVAGRGVAAEHDAPAGALGPDDLAGRARR